MSFFTPDEAKALAIVRMDFQVVGAGEFAPRPKMTEVEYADFFLARILDVDVAPVYTLREDSKTKATLEAMATKTRPVLVGGGRSGC